MIYKICMKLILTFPFLRSKKYYLVFRNEKRCGICSHLIVYLQMFATAERLGMKPIVDMKNYGNPYIDEGKRENAWNYFFKDCIDNCNLDTIPLSKCFTFNKCGVRPFSDIKILKWNKEEVKFWSEIYNRYIRYNDKLQTETDIEYAKYFKNIHNNGEKILGVKLRGTDYNGIKPEGHYIQPTAEEMVAEANKIMAKKKIGYVYLATEDEDIAEVFKKYFGNKLIVRENLLTNKGIAGLVPVAQVVAEQFGRIESGINYIKDIDLLSRADYLLTSGNSGAVLAIIMNDLRYKKVWFNNKGRYGFSN